MRHDVSIQERPSASNGRERFLVLSNLNAKSYHEMADQKSASNNQNSNTVVFIGQWMQQSICRRQHCRSIRNSRPERISTAGIRSWTTYPDNSWRWNNFDIWQQYSWTSIAACSTEMVLSWIRSQCAHSVATILLTIQRHCPLLLTHNRFGWKRPT